MVRNLDCDRRYVLCPSYQSRRGFLLVEFSLTQLKELAPSDRKETGGVVAIDLPRLQLNFVRRAASEADILPDAPTHLPHQHGGKYARRHPQPRECKRGCRSDGVDHPIGTSGKPSRKLDALAIKSSNSQRSRRMRICANSTDSIRLEEKAPLVQSRRDLALTAQMQEFFPKGRGRGADDFHEENGCLDVRKRVMGVGVSITVRWRRAAS
jgi:hypothetical protein